MSDRFSSSELRVQANEAADGSASALTPLIAARHLTPNKARILLMLALTRTTDGLAIQRFFDSY
jgi:L-asparaginase/Glu-tRNA(Gln) amidotransferase subunit D